MKHHFPAALLFLLLLLLGSGFQQPVSFGGNRSAAHNYPPDFPTVQRPLTVNYSKDSLRVVRLAHASWNFYWAKQWDSMLLSSQALHQLAAHLLEQKVDSTLFECWYQGYTEYGQAMVYLGNIREGSDIINEAVAIARRVRGDNLMSAIGYYGAGHMAIDLFDDPDLALDYYRMGESIARKCLAPDDVQLINGLRNLGKGYWLKGDYETALRYYQQVLDFKNLPAYRKEHTYTHIGDRYAEIGNAEQALHHYLLARPFGGTHPEYDFHREVAIADACLQLNRISASQDQLRRCDSMYARNQALLSQSGYTSDWLRAKAKAAFRAQNVPLAVALSRAAIAEAERSNGGKTSPTTLALWQQLAEFYLSTDSLSAARATVQELFAREAPLFKPTDFSQNPNPEHFSRQTFHLITLQLKGRILERQFGRSGKWQDLEGALSVYLLADSLIDRLRDTYRGVGSKNQLAGSAKAIYQRGIDCAFRLWQKTASGHWLETAWQLAEKSKSIGLLESFRETEAQQLANMQPEDLQGEKQVKRDIQFYEKLVFDEQNKAQPVQSRISFWNRRIVALKNTGDSLLAVFKSRYPEYYRLKYNRNIAPIPAIQSKLADSTALVEYFLGDSLLFTFLIDNTQCQLFRQRLDTHFEQNLAALRTTVHGFEPEQHRSAQEKKADFHQFTSAAFGLYQNLLAQPLRQTRAANLILIPDEQLGYIPFAALLEQPVPPSHPVNYRPLPYLIRNYSIRLEYSGTLLLHQPTAAAPGAYLGMAPSYSASSRAIGRYPDSLRFQRAFPALRGGGVPALRFAREEVEAAQAIASGNARSGASATEAFFKQYAPSASVLHLAMHALTNDTDPLYSTLVFSGLDADTTSENDGFLHAYELYNLRLQAKLAVLSACNTGAGKMVRGEGIMSLARAFKFAGCPNVMMSLWPVNDLAAKELVLDFFKNLDRGYGKAQALQAAQLNFLNTTKVDKLMHPYYWATFILLGDDEPVHWGTALQPWVWLLLTGAGILGVRQILRRRRPAA
ncbi:MAG: CHAT domain-containing protein [Saprospiraceae bacterium]|nr:CHAT domain-containing protein [Saprospiraceae bacterium]